MITIKKAQPSDLPDLIPLFDGYRMFYKQASDYKGAKKFLTERLTRGDSIIFVADNEGIAVGFTQLFPIFSSVSMEPMFLLNDLYVEKNYRGKGIGQALIQKAKDLCISQKLKGLALQTETTNPAQKLYEHLGFVLDSDLHYFWTNSER